MRNQRMIPVILAMLLLLGATATLAENRLPPADAEQLWNYMTRVDPYRGWGFWPGYSGMYPGKSPHGKYLKLYANSIALQAARERKPLPPGSIIVKENYGKDKKTLKAVTPMYKIKGFAPEAGDWFWVKYGTNGKVFKAGKIKSCIDCHRAAKANGWVFTEPK